MPASLLRSRAPFVDAHVHLRDARGLADIAAAGVVAVRDAGSPAFREGQVREALLASQHPRVVASGWALSKAGGYGARLGTAVETTRQAAEEISRLAGAGAAIIKVIASGVVSLANPGTVTDGGFSGEELTFIVQEAARYGLSVMAHANGEEAIIAACGAGVRSIEHGFFMTERALAAIADRGVFWVPTAGALLRAAAGAPAPVRAYISGLVRRHQDLIRTAWVRGVALAAGTDAVLPHQDYRDWYDQELTLFLDAGIPAEDVLHIATRRGAELLQIELP